MKRRVAVTGIGLVSPHGDAPLGVFDDLLAGRSAVTLGDDGDAPAAAVARAPFDATRWFTRLQLAGVDRVSQIAVAAAQMARDDAGIATLDAGTGVYVGTGMGGAMAVEESFRSHYASGRVPPLSVPAFMPNAPAAHVAMREKLHGPVYTYSIACASSAVALAEAAKAVAYGEVDCALAGGTEALLVPGAIRAWHALQTLARVDDEPWRACRPFSTDRTGLVLGEGAAFVVLEPYDAALSRGARIYAEFAGSGVSCDATHLTKPDVTGQVRAITAALRNSALNPSDIGYCNAHGTATRIGDVVECKALESVWGDAIGNLAVSSTKSMHGHLLGAAGALESIVTILALYRGAIPPNMHCDEQDIECNVALVRDPGHGAPALRAAISNSFAFGGTNTTLVFKRAT
ncbi:beta-ketoacyl-[acyl-carrier-protein] synthase family protein [Massilia sp. TW-1]|uniref:Nodulation protein E n=1 Tax=Telluria antibiotica TaxID=2717319 RepID=A0ABX0P6Z1_9BURK|nr:beta-ketoacyl-[acyl-carrier-protein] synthase family protein [Telluria antibiotica]NIA53029.1 beta-ketoacyl-[acyl-carrier-protein] synthase family protein [Telluria antibiotica]